ncbi:MAG TPA: PIN domain-containing protein [Chloroflexota bacterium]|nr:PIN domain-containing protein [Chloroflexota bacterium]
MTYLLDTDILSHSLRRAPSPALIARIAAVAPAQRLTSCITVGELLYGAHRVARLQPDLLQRIESLLLAHVTMVPFDEAAARRYGALRAYLERQGTPLADADLRIAAIALVRGLVMVTGNVRHFQRVPGLVVENWLV